MTSVLTMHLILILHAVCFEELKARGVSYRNSMVPWCISILHYFWKCWQCQSKSRFRGKDVPVTVFRHSPDTLSTLNQPETIHQEFSSGPCIDATFITEMPADKRHGAAGGRARCWRAGSWRAVGRGRGGAAMSLYHQRGLDRKGLVDFNCFPIVVFPFNAWANFEQTF